ARAAGRHRRGARPRTGDVARPRRRTGRAMSPISTNVRAIRPMRILLVTDDVRYADELASAASQRGFDLAQTSVGGDLDLEATAQAPNIVVLDAHDALARTSRTATAFAALHPQIATVI